ncbi:MAG: hypothetical protein AAF716_00070 [Cyanobacteria bacterium P01_D01_bin.1]
MESLRLGGKAVIYDIVLSREDNKYVARSKEWPEVSVVETSREAAVDQIKSRLLDYLTSEVEVIQIDIPLAAQSKNPVLDKFGWFKNDPTFDDLQSEIASYRQELDQEMGDLGDLTE